MKYFKKITLKDGRECVLRNGDENDGAAALENFTVTHEQTDFLLSYPDEISYTVESEAEFLKKSAESEDGVEILAFVDGKIAGMAGIEPVGRHFKTKHRAEFGVSINLENGHLGIGSALTAACIECAKKAGFKQIELDVVADNERAIGLYKKFGFVEYGRNPKGFLSRFSGFQELIYMRLEL